jgi:hypothetical protein
MTASYPDDSMPTYEVNYEKQVFSLTINDRN